jgi:hypothetical protein
MIEEVKEEDNYEEDNVNDLAARNTRLNKDQHKQLLS